MSVLNTTLVGRRLEAHVLLMTADRLQRVIDAWDTSGNETRLRDAVSRTHMLWSIFQDSLANTDHPMPDETKINVLNISLFIDQRLTAVIADPSPDKLATVPFTGC